MENPQSFKELHQHKSFLVSTYAIALFALLSGACFVFEKHRLKNLCMEITPGSSILSTRNLVEEKYLKVEFLPRQQLQIGHSLLPSFDQCLVIYDQNRLVQFRYYQNI